MPDFSARQRRIYRAQSAAFLASNGLTGKLANDGTASQSLNWAALESVPHWCFLPITDQRTLRLLCGAVFLAPQMHSWIEGRRIQGVRELIGPEAYRLVLCGTVPLANDWQIEESGLEMESVLDQAGYAVLLGAISQPVIQAVVAGATAGNSDALACKIADPLYRLALDIFAQLREQGQQPDSPSDSQTAAPSDGAAA